MDKEWYLVENIDELPSPSLIVFPDRVNENIERAISIVGDPARLRPHIKTHKMPQIIALHLRDGITKFKCATIAEAEMAARAGAKDILLATQPVGPNIKRLAQLFQKYEDVKFSTLCDNLKTAEQLAASFPLFGTPIPIYIDIDSGMHRTGILPEQALDLYKAVSGLKNLRVEGLHVYDGHIHEPDPDKRKLLCDQGWQSVLNLRAALEQQGLPVPHVIAGGTPTFPFHAEHEDRECSPGTYVFWDFGYQKFHDLDFLISALLITRVISKPAPDRLCLDLGHKAVASENPQPRVQFLNLPNASLVMHSEEHLVIETPEARTWNIGDVLYAVPRHICPTVALHDFAYTIEDGKAEGKWETLGRHRVISI
jgi:D-serine deaminase-like pyridoxal phosphate-dependent protein